MEVHALDSCALTDLAESDRVVDRHCVVAHVRKGRLVVPVTQGLQWELPATRAVNEWKYRRMVDLLGTLSGGNVLMNVPARGALEARARRPLTQAEIFTVERFRPIVDAPTVDAQAAYGAEMSRELLREEAGRVAISISHMDDVARQLGESDQRGTGTSRWRRALKNARSVEHRVFPFAEKLARAALEKMAIRAHLDVSSLDARTLPTFWSAALIHVARVRDVVVLGQSLTSRRAPGQLDVVHLQEAAAYADVFVTSDTRLRKFAGRVRGLTCRVLSLPEWIAHLEELR